jgi:hypothetical protein
VWHRGTEHRRLNIGRLRISVCFVEHDKHLGLTSIALFEWLHATSSGPSSGTFSLPSTIISLKKLDKAVSARLLIGKWLAPNGMAGVTVVLG